MIHKIAIIGPEASGKSTLSQKLANYFQEPWVREYAREFLMEKNGNYEKKDLLQIAKGQKLAEREALKTAKQFLFCDTTLLVIQVWSEFKYGDCDPLIINKYKAEDYNLHLLLQPDLKYENDPLRENPSIEEREKLFEIYRLKLKNSKANFAIIRGHGDERLKNSLKVLHSQFSF